MENTQNKCVIILDEELPAGIQANTAAILGMSLGRYIPECVGEDIIDGSGLTHKGITTVPIPILKGTKDNIKELRNRLYNSDSDDLFVVDFSDLARTSHSYHNYTAKTEAISQDEISYLGLALYGSKKKINSLSGSLALLK